MALFYTLEEAAAIVGLSAPELRRKVQDGELRAMLLGGSPRLRPAEVHELARRRGLRVAPPAEAAPAPAAPAPEPAPAPVATPALGDAIAERPPAAVPQPARDAESALREAIALIQEMARRQGILPADLSLAAVHQAIPAPPQAEAPGASGIDAEAADPTWDDLLQQALELTKAGEAEEKAAGEDGANGGDGAVSPVEAAARPPRPEPRRIPNPAAVDVGILTVRCPNPACQDLGRVPIDRLDQQMRCIKCGTRFYLDPLTNETILGDRPAPEPQKTQADTAPARARHSRVEAAFDRWLALPPKRKLVHAAMAAGAAAALFLIASLLWPSVPNTPMERARTVVAALARNDPAHANDITAPATLKILPAFVRKARPASWPPHLADVPVRMRVLFLREKRKSACIEAEFPINPTPPPGEDPFAVAEDPNAPQLIDTESQAPAAPAKAAPARAAIKAAARPATPVTGPRVKLFFVLDNGVWMFDPVQSANAVQ